MTVSSRKSAFQRRGGSFYGDHQAGRKASRHSYASQRVSGYRGNTRQVVG